MKSPKKDSYTAEEMLVLASLRKKTGRTCASCAWYLRKGAHRGCYPDGKYRKWLSPREFDSGCDLFTTAKKQG